ncbi:MAG: bifunctional diaminohydroxyphosphoribosylaminopyrimidine deaminase/5-amino-6-(5-phosphoribosylamino)uracil reductase RibD [Alphaproteobacteria bacterium]
MSDAEIMRVALSLAARGLGRTAPNPTVGCVLVAPDGKILGQARTADAGRPHAETQALAQAGANAAGATAYVTLEPCAHHGQTGPCAQALIDAGVARVVIATLDPDPRTAGKGAAMLRAAGIGVSVGVLEAQAKQLNAGFIKRIETGLPFLTLKLALSIDGKIALSNGESQWITGPQARARGHLLRAQSDFLLTGAKTVLKDQPRFTVRLAGMESLSPRVGVVYDADRSNQEIVGWVKQQRPDWMLLPGWNFEEHLKTIGETGATRVLAEAGGGVAKALMANDLVDEIVVFRAGKVLGGDARDGIGVFNFQSLDQAPHFTRVETGVLGEDLMEVWRRI